MRLFLLFLLCVCISNSAGAGASSSKRISNSAGAGASSSKGSSLLRALQRHRHRQSAATKEAWGDAWIPSARNPSPPWLVAPVGLANAAPRLQPAPLPPPEVYPMDPYILAPSFSSAAPASIAAASAAARDAAAKPAGASAAAPAKSEEDWYPLNPSLPFSNQPIRPLTLFDAKGAEYAEAAAAANGKKTP